MKREEIIKRKQNENFDEGKAFIENEGARVGGKGFIVFTTVVMVYNLYLQLRIQNIAILSIFTFYLGCEGLGKYGVTKRKVEIISIIGGFIMSLGLLIYYIVLTY